MQAQLGICTIVGGGTGGRVGLGVGAGRVVGLGVDIGRGVEMVGGGEGADAGGEGDAVAGTGVAEGANASRDGLATDSGVVAAWTGPCARPARAGRAPMRIGPATTPYTAAVAVSSAMPATGRSARRLGVGWIGGSGSSMVLAEGVRP